MHSWARSSVLQDDINPDEDENINEQLSDIISNTADGDSRLGSQREERTESRFGRRTQSTQPSSAASVSSVVSEDAFEVRSREKIRVHPNPGNSANKLNNLVNMPFRAYFGSSRVPSSRELEQQRAASSQKPITPLLKDNEPELILDDTPFHSPTTIPTRVGQQQQRGTSQTQLQKSQPLFIQQPPVQSKQEQQQQTTITRFADRSTQTEQQQQSSSQRQYRPPSPPGTPSRLPTLSPILQHQPAQQSDWRPRSLSISDFPPFYDLNHGPRVPPPINVDSWALGVGHYRRMHLDNMVKRIQEHEKMHAKLAAKLSRFDKQNKQELDELELMRREQELEVRRRQHEERLREQEELERRLAARTENLTAAPRQTAQFSRSSQNPLRPSSAPLHSILKKPLAPPPRSFSFPNANAAAGRVAFRSPIRSVNLYSPNRSRDNSSSMAVAADEEAQLENEPTCSQNIAPTTISNRQRWAVPQKKSSTMRNGRFVLTNQTNNANNNGNGHSGSSIGENMQAEREREGKRMDYLNKWQQNRQQLEKAKRLNPRVNRTSNPTSIFQHIPAHPT